MSGMAGQIVFQSDLDDPVPVSWRINKYLYLMAFPEGCSNYWYLQGQIQSLNNINISDSSTDVYEDSLLTKCSQSSDPAGNNGLNTNSKNKEYWLIQPPTLW